MTQLTITLDLEDYAKPSEIRKILKNIKGVARVSTQNKTLSSIKKQVDEKEWLAMIDKLQNSVNPSNIDWNDERTRYIMGER